MKKLGILTLVFHNYGTALQAYAMSRVLNRMKPQGVYIEVINLETPWKGASLRLIPFLKQILCAYKWRAFGYCFNLTRWVLDGRKICKVSHLSEIKKRDGLFSYLDGLIPYTEKKYTYEDVRQGLFHNYDAILVGSDQVWNELKIGNPDIFCLEFFDKKKLTYAASFGTTSISVENFDRYKKNISSFDSLLIREQEGVNLCKQMGRNDAEYVLDPTLLLKANEYDELVNRSETKVRDNFVLVYSLNFSYKIYSEAYKLAKKNNCKMVVLKRSFCPPNINKFENAEELYAVSPEAFLWLIKHARCVVTNSYHAMLFSINFNRNFYTYLDNRSEANSRIFSIVHMLGLEKRVFWETQVLPKTINEIDYKNANDVLEKCRKQSTDLLKESLRCLI